MCMSTTATTSNAKKTIDKDDDDDGEWPLLRELRRACKDYELIKPGDKIAVAVSGGKDSSTLAFLLHQMKTRRLLPFDDWDFTTIHLDQVQPGHDASSGIGGRHRSGPMGGWAKGMPRKLRKRDVASPRTTPFAVSTKSESSAAIAKAAWKIAIMFRI